MTSTPADPLAALLARLRAADPDLELIAGRPTSAGWVVLGEALEDPACVERWLDRIRPETAGSDAVAGSFLASWLGGVVVAPLYRALVRERRTWPCRAAGVLVRQHEDGWFDGLAITDRTVRVLPGDRVGRLPGCGRVRRPDEPPSRSVVEDLAQTLGPVFAAIRRQTRLGMPAMWGSVADTIGGVAMADAVAQAEDPRGAFADATSLRGRTRDRGRRSRCRACAPRSSTWHGPAGPRPR